MTSGVYLTMIDYLVSLFETHQIMMVVAALFITNLAITSFEIILDMLTNKERRWKDTLANCLIFIAHQVAEKTAFASLGFVALLPFYILTPLQIPMTIFTWLLALLAADFTYYWMHRLEHKHRILWASHSVHHSSEDYNLTVGFRLSLVEGLFEWAFLIPMILVGFNPFQALVALVLVAQYQHWIHTERVGKLGWLDEIFNTPSVHRVHHGSNRQYLDKNFGGVLMIWDKIFGTFAREEEKVVYGLTRNINTNNPIKITFVEFGNIWRDVRKCRNNRDRIKIIFGGLSWRPDYFPNVKSERINAPLTFISNRNHKSYMKKNSRLSAVLHALLHMAERDEPMTSDALAACLSTNAVVVRRTMGLLRDAKIVTSERGHAGGWRIAVDLSSVTLRQLHETLGEPAIFAIGNSNEDSQCLVEQAVNAALAGTLIEAEALLLKRFGEITLADLAQDFAERHALILSARAAKAP